MIESERGCENEVKTFTSQPQTLFIHGQTENIPRPTFLAPNHRQTSFRVVFVGISVRCGLALPLPVVVSSP